MSISEYKFQFPLKSLSADTLIGKGASSVVFAINPRVAFKCPTVVVNPAGIQKSIVQENIDRVESEKHVYSVLMRNHHPNILCAILCSNEGIFLPKFNCNLHERLENSTASQNDRSTQSTWIRGLANGLSWLESLGYAHGDLRPSNILVDHSDQVKLCDFDATVEIGKPLLVATDPFCRVDENFDPPLAGHTSEQFAFASCVYNIRYGQIPFHDLDSPSRVQKLIKNELPSTADDLEYGNLIWACWHGEYASIQKVQQEVASQKFSGACAVAEDVESSLGVERGGEGGEDDEMQMLRRECEDFLAANKY